MKNQPSRPCRVWSSCAIQGSKLVCNWRVGSVLISTVRCVRRTISRLHNSSELVRHSAHQKHRVDQYCLTTNSKHCARVLTGVDAFDDDFGMQRATQAPLPFKCDGKFSHRLSCGWNASKLGSCRRTWRPRSFSSFCDSYAGSSYKTQFSFDANISATAYGSTASSSRASTKSSTANVSSCGREALIDHRLACAVMIARVPLTCTKFAPIFSKCTLSYGRLEPSWGYCGQYSRMDSRSCLSSRMARWRKLCSKRTQ